MSKALKNKGGTTKGKFDKDIKEYEKEDSDDHVGVPVRKYTE